MSQYENVMLDLETMSTQPNAAITSIGAVRFNREEITSEFSVFVDLQSSVDAGLVIDAETVKWWMKQSDAAREILQVPGDPLVVALADFAEWVGPKDRIWGNGSDFDNVIMSSAYQRCGIALPWRWSNNRCYRTLKSEHPNIEIERDGVHHNAVDDARSQAWHLIRIWGQDQC